MTTTKFESQGFEPVITPGIKEKRFVYDGDKIDRKVEYSPKVNRPVRLKKRSPFNTIISLFMISVIIIFYIWNKICVNRLAVEVNDLRNQYEKILNANEFLNAEINKKSSLERIGKIAAEQIGLVAPKEQPVWFQVDVQGIETLHLDE